MKLVYVSWFFEFLGYCISDFGNFKENWNDLQVKICLDKDPEVRKWVDDMNEVSWGLGDHIEYIEDDHTENIKRRCK